MMFRELPDEAQIQIRAHHRAHEIAPHWYDPEDDGSVTMEDMGAVMAIEALAAYALFRFRGDDVPPILEASMRAALVGMEPDPSSFITHVAAISQMRLDAGDFGDEPILQVRYATGLANSIRLMIEMLRSSDRQWGPKAGESLEDAMSSALAGFGEDHAPAPRRTIFVDADVDPYAFDPAELLERVSPAPFVRALASLAEDGNVVFMVPDEAALAVSFDVTDELGAVDVRGETVVRGKQPARRPGDIWVAVDERRRAEFEAAGLAFYTPDELVVTHARFEDLKARSDAAHAEIAADAFITEEDSGAFVREDLRGSLTPEAFARLYPNDPGPRGPWATRPPLDPDAVEVEEVDGDIEPDPCGTCDDRRTVWADLGTPEARQVPCPACSAF